MPQTNLKKQAGTFSGSCITYSECFSSVVWPEHSRTNSFHELCTGGDGRQDEQWTPEGIRSRTGICQLLVPQSTRGKVRSQKNEGGGELIGLGRNPVIVIYLFIFTSSQSSKIKSEMDIGWINWQRPPKKLTCLSILLYCSNIC